MDNELYKLIDDYWAEYKDKTQDIEKNKLKNGKYVSDYIVGEIPIVWFGDFESYKKSELKVVTVGQNPSSIEFKDNRFPGLAKKNAIYNDAYRERLAKSYNEYFKKNPYLRWFDNGYGQLFKLFSDDCSVSYGYDKNNERYRATKNIAIHIDYYSALATFPAWGRKDLPNDVRKILSENVDKLYRNLIRKLNPDVVLLHTKKKWSSLVVGTDRFVKHEFYGRLKGKEKAKKHEVRSCVNDGKLYVWGPNYGVPWEWLDSMNDKNQAKFHQILDDFKSKYNGN